MTAMRAMTDLDPTVPRAPVSVARAPELPTDDASGEGSGGSGLPAWVHLLAPGELDDVVVVGPVGRATRTAAPEPASAGAVVLTHDGRRAVERAIAAVRPGGVLWVERSRRHRRPWLTRRLRARGFSVSSWWRRPSRGSTWASIRLDDPRAAASVIRTVANRGGRTGVEALLAAKGVAGLVSAEVSLLARAAGGEDPPWPLVQPGPGEHIDALLSPQFSSSRAVIGVSTTGPQRRLSHVVKVARDPDDDPAIAAEAEHLLGLIDRAGPFPGAPLDVRLVRRGERTVLVEAAVPGTPLDRRAVREDPMAAVVAARRWLLGLPVGTPSRPVDDGRATALLTDPLDRVAALPGPRAADRADLARRARALVAPLAEVPLPVVFEHGDLSHPNIMRADDGALAVVDWERARADGLPLHDLLFFLAYVVESADRPSSPADLGPAFQAAIGVHGWARAEVSVYAERLALDRRLLPRLQVASWTRRVADLAEPLAARPERHRVEVLWEAAVTAAERGAR